MRVSFDSRMGESGPFIDCLWRIESKRLSSHTNNTHTHDLLSRDYYAYTQNVSAEEVAAYRYECTRMVMVRRIFESSTPINRLKMVLRERVYIYIRYGLRIPQIKMREGWRGAKMTCGISCVVGVMPSRETGLG